MSLHKQEYERPAPFLSNLVAWTGEVFCYKTESSAQGRTSATSLHTGGETTLSWWPGTINCGGPRGGQIQQEAVGWPRKALQVSARGEPLVSLPFAKTQTCIQPQVPPVSPVHL